MASGDGGAGQAVSRRRPGPGRVEANGAGRAVERAGASAKAGFCCATLRLMRRRKSNAQHRKAWLLKHLGQHVALLRFSRGGYSYMGEGYI
jgi:hypothetical protein